LVLSPSRRLLRLGPDDFTSPPGVLGHIELPQPHAPKGRPFQRETLERLRKAKVRRPDRAESRGRGGGADADDELAALERAVSDHPVDADPNKDEVMRAVATVTRLEREQARLTAQVAQRTESLGRQLDIVRGLLERWGYLDDWSLTPAGEILARLYTETDLLLAETVREGLLDGLSPPETAALVSCFSYETRGGDGAPPMPPARWPTSRLADRSRKVEKMWRRLGVDEQQAGLPLTRQPDPGFIPYAYEWASGNELASVLDDDELTGGDFVRHVKQCIDLLRQVGDVALDPATRANARSAADACTRGVVALTGVLTA
jgi:ATP-dependent RNA helicase HelY